MKLQQLDYLELPKPGCIYKFEEMTPEIMSACLSAKYKKPKDSSKKDKHPKTATEAANVNKIISQDIC